MPETKTPSRAAMECAEALDHEALLDTCDENGVHKPHIAAEVLPRVAAIIDEKMGMGEVVAMVDRLCETIDALGGHKTDARADADALLSRLRG